ncbi:efflux RND transporter periplasmic adaptor subunit [Methylobacterium sp. NEAU 140]|uniref:HlyD family efflux transporter periplasmic adaptor subunit n=1 Tax=Methylobacterium sp. NEAU 140 TaxID=3064945 RepID=UPI00273568C8|nr:HlyD family efflux transporter periplasmic adaptor subunit [Methylobacterium sp. NEAU 140]MDP4021204.1 efflux RND transporter periplasmic adaptor subunit [Methylobacterium sp. NEAU 140]
MKRTIAAILAADVAGYSRLVAEDEEDALARLAAAKAVFREAVDRFGGRVFNTAGDAILAEFPSAVEALRAALAIQGTLGDQDQGAPPERRVRFRMGLNLGDVVEVDGDLLGDGVNIAARLEGIADPGGICLSRSLHEAVSGKVRVTFRDAGARRLKNIPRPVHVFRVVMPGDPAGAAAREPGRSARARAARWGTLAAALLIALGLGGLWRAGYLTGGGETAAVAEGVRDDLIAVSVVRARRACFPDEIRLTGVVVPRRAVDVRPEVEGLNVARVTTAALESVREGQVLAELRRPGEADGRRVDLRSPVAGLVLRAEARPGAPAAAAAAPLFQIAEGATFELEAQAPLAALDRLAAGQDATVTPLGGPPGRARVRFVARDVDPATQLGRVRLALVADDASAAAPRAGGFASAVVSLGERCGVAVPFSAVSREAEGPVVYVASNGRVEARPVTVGLGSGRDVEIRSGLDERDTVVARAGAFLREGDAVRPVAAAP